MVFQTALDNGYSFREALQTLETPRAPQQYQSPLQVAGYQQQIVPLTRTLPGTPQQQQLAPEVVHHSSDYQQGIEHQVDSQKASQNEPKLPQLLGQLPSVLQYHQVAPRAIQQSFHNSQDLQQRFLEPVDNNSQFLYKPSRYISHFLNNNNFSLFKKIFFPWYHKTLSYKPTVDTSNKIWRSKYFRLYSKIYSGKSGARGGRGRKF